MKKITTVILAIFTFSLSFAFSEVRNALLIANGNYKAFGSLATPIKEARDLKATLEKLNFKVTILEDGSREKMLDAVEDFGNILNKQGGIGFFHYGGHAVQVNGANYLIPVDADIPDEKRVKTRTLDVDEVMQSMTADTNIVILDACRNNPLPSSSGRSATRGLVLTNERPKNSIVVYSAEAGCVAKDGVFTPILTKKLLEQKELSTVLREVRREVNQRTNGAQTPKNDDGLMEEIYLAGHKVSLPAVIAENDEKAIPSSQTDIQSAFSNLTQTQQNAKVQETYPTENDYPLPPLPATTFKWRASDYIEKALKADKAQTFGTPTACGQVVIGGNIYRRKTSDGNYYFSLSPATELDSKKMISFAVPAGEHKITFDIKLTNGSYDKGILCLTTSITDMTKVFETATINGKASQYSTTVTFKEDTIVYAYAKQPEREMIDGKIKVFIGDMKLTSIQVK